MARIIHKALIPAALTVFGLFAFPFLAWIPDDAYISFQYARNLSEGRGLVFAAGERVEGFSNLLWTLVLALLHRVKIDIVTGAVALSCLAALAAMILMGSLIRRAATGVRTDESSTTTVSIQDTFVVALLLLTAATYLPFTFYASSGLETAFYLLLLVSATWVQVQAIASNTRRLEMAALGLFLAAALTRPEAIGFLLISGGFAISSQAHRSRIGSVLVLCAIFYAGVILARHTYYGDWIPNTYYAKPGAAWQYWDPLIRGARYLAIFMLKNGFILLLPWALRRPVRDRKVWYFLWTLVAYQAAFIVFVGGDILRFDRFTVPLLPWLLTLTALGVRRLHRPRRGVLAALAACVSVILVLNVARSYRAHEKYCIHDWMNAHPHRAIGRMLHDTLPEGSLLVANEIGAISYYSRRRVIDMLGLTDATISHLRFRSFKDYGVGSSEWSVPQVSRYLLDYDPECILLPAYRDVTFTDATGRAEQRDAMHLLWYGIFTHKEFINRYRPVLKIKIHARKFIFVCLRNDIEPDPHTPLPTARRCLEVTRISDR